MQKHLLIWTDVASNACGYPHSPKRLLRDTPNPPENAVFSTAATHPSDAILQQKERAGKVVKTIPARFSYGWSMVIWGHAPVSFLPVRAAVFSPAACLHCA